MKTNIFFSCHRFSTTNAYKVDFRTCDYAISPNVESEQQSFFVSATKKPYRLKAQSVRCDIQLSRCREEYEVACDSLGEERPVVREVPDAVGVAVVGFFRLCAEMTGQLHECAQAVRRINVRVREPRYLFRVAGNCFLIF